MNVIETASLTIQSDEIVLFLKHAVQYKAIYQGILQQKIIQKAAIERNVTVTPEQIQAEADRVRRERRLEKAADTLAWLKSEQISADEWEQGIHAQILANNLAEAMFGKDVDRFFAENRLDFDRVVLYQIIVVDEAVAQEVFFQIEEEEISFYEAAHLYDMDEERRQKCGYEGTLYRWNIPPAIATALFAATPKQVIGPIPYEKHYRVMMVDAFLMAELNDPTRQEIRDRLFQEWMSGELNALLHGADS